jgi:hypothetical protein
MKEYQEQVEGRGSIFKHTKPPSETSESGDQAKTSPDAEDESKREQKDTEDSTKPSGKSTDPLRWFGILVPPALRTAQSTFVGAVEGPIPQLATIARDLRMQGIEIGRVKKQIKKL